MDLVTQFSTALTAAAAVFVVHFLSRGRFEAINARFERLEGEIAGVKTEMAQMRRELAAIRSDLTHVALAVGARREPNTG